MAKKLKSKSYLTLVPFFLIQIVWGSYFLIAKNLQTQINIYFLHFLRFALLSLIFLPFALKFLKDKKLIIGGIIGGLLLAGSNYLLNVGLNISSAVNAAFLIGLTTIFVTLIEVIFYKAKMEKNRVIATILAIVGMWFITGGIKGLDLGDTVLILGSVIGAFHVIFLDKSLNKKSKILPHLFWQMLACAVVGLVMNIFFGSFDLPTITTGLVGEFLYLALISMGLGMIVQMWTQERVNPIVVSIIALFQSIFGAVIGWTLGHEAFVISQAIGGGIILVGMFLSVISDKDADLKSLD